MKNTPFTLIASLTLVSTLAMSGCERKDPNHPEIHNLNTSSSQAGAVGGSTEGASTENDSNDIAANSAASSFATVTNAESADFATDAWIGKWNGPEGTFLNIEGNKGVYTLTIQTLDGSTTYQGQSLGDRISFERNGTTETIHVSEGKDTGMKWLADKKNCLMIREGEGFCRD